jgi:hypothetical protein
MTSESASHAGAGPLFGRADELLDAAAAEGLTLRLAGGLGIAAVAPSARREPLAREYHDLDFAGLARESRNLQRLLPRLGYVPHERFNTMQGLLRLIFAHGGDGLKVEVFLDAIRMCHTIELRRRLQLAPRTLAPADLFLAKMQIVELTRKDATDVLALLTDVPLGDDEPTTICVPYIRKLTSEDWGLYRTIELNVARVQAFASEFGYQVAASAVTALLRLFEALEVAPKSTRWKLRAKVGDRVRWYELPEEALRPPTTLDGSGSAEPR